MDPSSEWFLLGFNVDAELRGKLGGPPAVGFCKMKVVLWWGFSPGLCKYYSEIDGSMVVQVLFLKAWFLLGISFVAIFGPYVIRGKSHTFWKTDL